MLQKKTKLINLPHAHSKNTVVIILAKPERTPIWVMLPLA